MSTEPFEWSRVREVFEAACDRDPSERTAFLEQACGQDGRLRGEVERLLRLDRAIEVEIEPPDSAELLDALERASDLGLEGQRVGAYVLRRRIGAGGMGTVWLAERADEQFEKRVAVKVVRLGLDTEEVLRRFLNERQLLADLDHPGITRLIDAGVTDDGRPCLVMEFVEGVPIDRWCGEHRTSVRQRLELFRRVCETVDYAHRRGVVHRDLKPGNVLVTEDGRPKLLDFGIAKILKPEPGAEVTRADLRLHTPAYASPEQVQGLGVTTASDVYSLGVVLFELLTGRHPYRTETTSRREVERAVVEDEPPRISGRIPGWTRRDDDLDNIVSKALCKEPELRYPTAAELSADLGRLGHGLPVTARPATWRYRAVKLVRRNKALASALALLLLVFATATVISSALFLNARAGWRAESARRAESERREYRARIATATAGLDARDVIRARRELDLAPAELRGWEWRHLAARLDRSTRAAPAHLGAPLSLALAPGGDVLALGGQRGRVVQVDVESTRLLRSWSGPATLVYDLAFSPDGGTIAAALQDHAFVFLDAGSLELSHSWERSGPGPRSLAFDQRWEIAVCGFMDGTFEVREVASGDRIAGASTEGLEVQAVALAPDGQRLATGTSDGRVQLFEVAGAGPLGPAWQLGDVWCLAFDALGERLAVGQTRGTVTVLDLGSGAIAAEYDDHGDRVVRLAFRPREDELLSASHDGTIRVTPLAAGRPARVLLGHTGPVAALVYDPDRERLFSAAQDGTLRTWGGEADDVRTLGACSGWFQGMALSPDARLLATTGGGHRVAAPCLQVTEVASGSVVWSTSAHEGHVLTAAWSPDGRHVATSSATGAWRLWDVEARECALVVHAHPSEILGLAFSPDGELLASAGGDDTVRIWSLEDGGGHVGTLEGHENNVMSVRFSRDGSHLLTASWDHTARIWDARTFEQLAVLAGHEGGLWQAVYHPWEDRIATASWDRTVRIWDAATGTERVRLEGHTDNVHCLAFTPDGSRLASGSEDETVRLWDPNTGEEMAVLRGHGARIERLEFAADGSFLVSLDIDGEVRVWDCLADGAELGDRPAVGAR